jgi:hypothetical protein
MTNLRTLLEQAGGPASSQTPPAALVQADLARAHRALRHERVGRGTRGGLLAVAAAGVVAVIVQTGSPTDATPESTATPPPSSSTAGVGDTRMVAYTGTQPVGFTIDALPRGWEVQGVDTGVLTLAPAGIADRDPNSFSGKVAVFLEDLPPAATGDRVRPVQVGTTTGLLFENDLHTDGDRSGGTTLFVAQPSGTQLAVQVWSGLDWSDTAIAELGEAIHVTDAATVSVG